LRWRLKRQVDDRSSSTGKRKSQGTAPLKKDETGGGKAKNKLKGGKK